MNPSIHPALLAIALGVATMGAAQATPVPLPPTHKAGAVEYLSGGVGKGEAAAIEKAERHWPLTLEFAVKGKSHAAFAADVHVLVHDAKGHEVLKTDAAGPLLLARLAPGRYAVDATFDGTLLHESVQVVHGRPAKAVFLWPAGTGEHRS